MARAKLGSLITDLSGSIGSTTFQNSNAGTIIRNKPSFAGNFSTSRCTCRNYNYQIHKAWQTMSATDRTQWQTFANFINTKQKHSSYLNISGQALFYQINFYRLSYSLSLLLIPVFSSLRPLDLTCTLFLSAGNLTIIFSRNTNPTNEFVIFSITPVIKTSINNFKNKLKLVIFSPPTGSAQPIYTQYISLYGAQPITGNTLGFSWSAASPTTGLFLPFQSSIQTL